MLSGNTHTTDDVVYMYLKYQVVLVTLENMLVVVREHQTIVFRIATFAV